MTTMTIERNGTLTLPADVQEQCGLLQETSVRLVKTRSGICWFHFLTALSAWNSRRN